MKKVYRIIGLAIILIIVIAAAFIYRNYTPPKADLILSDVRIESKAGSALTFSYAITNKGEGSISLEQLYTQSSQGLYVKAYIAQDTVFPHSNVVISHLSLINTGDLPELPPGQTLTDSGRIDTPKHLDEGEYLVVHLDPDDRVSESNEKNNFVQVPLYNRAEREEMKLRESVPLKDYLANFIYDFPEEAYHTRIPEGKTHLVFEQEYALKNKVILLENGRFLGPLFGYAHAYKEISSDIIWLTTSYTGEYGADTKIGLYVINTKNITCSDPYILSGFFGEDGWYSHQDGEFINDSTFQFRRYWNDSDFKDDSLKGTFVVR